MSHSGEKVAARGKRWGGYYTAVWKRKVSMIAWDEEHFEFEFAILIGYREDYEQKYPQCLRLAVPCRRHEVIGPGT